MSLTIKDIARMAHTSTATISRALSGKPGVSESKRQQIIELLDRVGYRPNRIAKNLALGRSNLLGLVVSNLRIPHYALLIGLIERYCTEKGYQLMVMDSSHDLQREIQNIEILLEHRAEGIFIIPVREYNSECDVEHFIRLRLERFPFVLIGKVEGFDLDYVTPEESNTASKLTQLLINMGHQVFSFLGYDPLNRTVIERLQGVHSAIEQAGLVLPNDLVIPEVGTWTNGGINSWHPVIQKLFCHNDHPTAVIAANDTIALIAIRYLENLGFDIPKDISVVGFDNSDFSALVRPGITTCAKNMDEVARLATEILTQKILDPKRKTDRCEVPQELIIRDSCGPAPVFKAFQKEVQKQEIFS